jgi:hypothetical protein
VHRLPPRPFGADPAARSGLASSRLARVLQQLHFGRLLVLAAAAVGVFFIVFRMLADDRSFYRAFLEGSAASFATLVVVGTGERFWNRAKIEEATGPGGWGVKFTRATTRSLRVAVDGLLNQMNTINERLLNLEEDVAALKESPPQPDHET